MKPSRLLTITSLLLSSVWVSAQQAPDGAYLTAPYGPGGTWNLYQARSFPMTWVEAETSAEAVIDPLGSSGKKGHLVCIGSAPENMFVYQMVSGGFIWLGLTDNEKWGGKEAGANRAGGWHWVSGEPVTYSAWDDTEPNQYNGIDEDGVTVGNSGYWSDWPLGVDRQQIARHASMVEWETNSKEPVPGAIVVGPVLPGKWPLDPLAVKTVKSGSGPWRVFSALGLYGGSMDGVVGGLADKMLKIPAPDIFAMPRLNYHLQDDVVMAGGWVPVTDRPVFPMMSHGCGALHVATVHLDKPATWSFNLHSDDYSAIRFPGLKWKSSTGLGGIDPLDPATLYYSLKSGNGHAIGVIDLPAGDSRIEVLLGNDVNDTMIQVLAAKGEITMDGGTDKWRFPGYKAAADLPWPGMDEAGWTITRTNRPATAPALTKLMDGLVLAHDGSGETAEKVATVNCIDSDGAGDIIFPDPISFPGDKPGGQDQFVVRATGNLVIPRDGLYHIGIHADGHCALRVIGQDWNRFIRDTGYSGKLQKDTIYGEDPDGNGSNVQLVAEIELKKGVYPIEALYANLQGPAVFSIFAAPAGCAPRLLAKDGAKIEPDIDGLPLK